MAAIWRLPLVLVCENNQFAMSARSDEMTAVDSLVLRGEGIGVPGVDVDGMDVLAVYDAVREAAALARAGEGPRMVVATCYRYEGHFAGDTLAYRDEAEAEQWRALDPIDAYARVLVELGDLAAADVEALEQAAAAAIDEAIEFARTSPAPPAEQAMEDIVA
jgi:TPP-dependent pyruvate/acetoin dehydrogenase alpha subunit